MPTIMIVAIIAANNKMLIQVGIGFLFTVSMVLFVKGLLLKMHYIVLRGIGKKFALSPEDR